jgi:Raf kinase inhibitor-like YbhB/YbcL family protein
MMFRKLSTLIQTLAMATAVCTVSTAFAMAQTPAPAGRPFTLTSPKLQDGVFLDKHFAGPTDAQNSCGGDNVSPPLQWSNAPANTKSFAVILYDFEGGRGPGVVHWVAYGIAPDVTSLAEGEGTTLSPRITGGSNMRQWATYFGPCSPPTDSPHHYIYSIYALDAPQDELPAGLTRDQFLAKVKGRVLSMTSLVATFQRSK